MDKVKEAFAVVGTWCRDHPKATAVIVALVVGIVIGAAVR